MNIDSLLHRQIHPSWVQNEITSTLAFSVGSHAFNPSSKDEGMLSTYNGDKFTGEESYNHYVKERLSVGVLSVLVSEVNGVGDLNIIEDDFPFVGHASIDFNTVSSTNQRTKKAQKLRDLALLRGWTYKI